MAPLQIKFDIEFYFVTHPPCYALYFKFTIEILPFQQLIEQAMKMTWMIALYNIVNL